MTRPLRQVLWLWFQVAFCLGAGLWATIAERWISGLHVAIWAMWSSVVFYVALRATWQEVRYWREVKAERRAYEARRARHVELRPWPRPRSLPPATRKGYP